MQIHYFKRSDHKLRKQMKKLVDLVGAFTGLAKDIFGKSLGLFQKHLLTSLS